DLARAGRALENRLAGRQHTRYLASTPRIGERPGWSIRARSDEEFDFVLTDLVGSRPERELVDLPRELVGVVAGELDQRTAGVRRDADSVTCELLRDPLRQLALRHLVDEHIPRLRARLGERRVLADLLPDKREHRLRRRSREVLRDRLRVRRLPALDALDQD